MVDGIYHLDDRLALMHHLFLAVKADDGQFALHEDPVVHHGVVVPAELLPDGYFVLYSHYLGTALQVVRQCHTIRCLHHTQVTQKKLKFVSWNINESTWMIIVFPEQAERH